MLTNAYPTLARSAVGEDGSEANTVLPSADCAIVEQCEALSHIGHYLGSGGRRNALMGLGCCGMAGRWRWPVTRCR